MKILSLFFITGLLASASYGYLTIDDINETFGPKCYDSKDNQELINGQTSPIPNSLETFVAIVERLEEKYNMERILRSLIAGFRFDDLRYKIPSRVSEKPSFVTRGNAKVKMIHTIFQDLFGSLTSDFKNNGFADFSEDEMCALYFMISHTVNDTVLSDKQEAITIGTEQVLKHPIEQGVVNLNTKTRHSFALGKVLQGIFAGLQDSERTVPAESIFLKKAQRPVPSYLKQMQINILYGVTIADLVAVTAQNMNEDITTGEDVLLPNGYWDDSVCPTKYILDDNNGNYATKALLRGAVDGLILGKKLKDIRNFYSDIRLSQILRIYYSSGMTSSDSTMSEVSWCNRHALFTSYQNEIVEEVTKYYWLFEEIQDHSKDEQSAKAMVNEVISKISQQSNSIFDEIYNEADEGCRTVSSGSKICETPRDVSAVLDYRAVDSYKEMQFQIIGNLSVGYHMSNGGGSSMAVYTNLKPGGGFKLDSINISSISGCSSCAAKYYGVFDTVTSNVENEIEVFRDLNRTLVPDDLPNVNDDEAGVPSKVVLYFNYGSPPDSRDLRNAVWDFQYEHRGTKVFAIGTKKEALRPFVESVDYDIFAQTDVRSMLTPLKERICKVPAQFQFKNCYTKSKSDEDTNIFHGFITPYHIQYWAMYPKYFLKSFNIQMSFTTMSGQIRVCFSRNYDNIYGTRQANLNCITAESDKEAIFYEKDPCKKYNAQNCRPFYFTIEALNVPEKKCTDKKCKTPNQIEFEFKHIGISCNHGISFAAGSPITLVATLFISIFFVFKH